MARLDRLGPTAREVAQAGAVIGREFGHTMVASITELPEPRLREALDRLTGTGLVFARGAPPEASYLFKHALVQDAAYGSLLRGRRQDLHGRIVTTTEERFPELAQAQPAMLAQHSTAADRLEQAVAYWLKAAQQTQARMAMAEAAIQARKGLEVLTALPDSLWQRQQELDLQLILGLALMTTKGFSATEAVETLARARALAEQLDRPKHLVPLMHGQWSVHTAQAEHRLALSLGKQIEDIGKVRNDAAVQALGRLLQGINRFHLGEFVTARALLEEHADPAHPPVDPIRAHVHAVRLAVASQTLALLGYIDQARSRMGEALSLGRRVRNAPTLAHMLVYACVLDCYTGSPLMHTEELLALSTEQKLAEWLAWALAFRGVSLTEPEQAQEAFALLTQGLGQLRTIGAAVALPELLLSLAQVTHRLGRSSEARRYLAEAAQMVEATDERAFEADVLHRVPGDLLNAAGDQSGAERHYYQAIAVAERQSAKLLQLRASTSLARLWYDQGRKTEAHDLLGPIYDWFTEGFDAPVLTEAKALLDDLAEAPT
jgi:tetratricopeptide (TPR) repeat protein